MSKSRSLVLALPMSVGLGAMNAGLPADAAEPARASVTASPGTPEASSEAAGTSAVAIDAAGAPAVATAPTSDAFDVVGSGRWWRRAWEVAKCAGLGLLVSIVSPEMGAVKFVTCYLS